jgi:Cu/Ag efflux protein CusF
LDINNESGIFRPGWVTSLLLVVVVAAFGGPGPVEVSSFVRYELKGVVVAVSRPHRRVTVRHEKVRDYMEAMTMPFFVKDSRVLDQLRAGDVIRAVLVVAGDGQQWLESIVVTGGSGGGTR